MATFKSILNKCEDAFYTAFNAIAATDFISGVTIYKATDQAEIVLPAILIESTGAERMADQATTAAAGENYFVTVQITAVTNGEDTTRAEHGNIAGLIEAVCFRSANQMVTELEAANVTDFQAIHYRAQTITAGMDDTRRTTTITAVVGCVSR